MSEPNFKQTASHGVYDTDPQADDSKFIKHRRSNVKSDLIEITEDKLENILLKHLEKMSLKSAWVAPASILVTIVTVKTTATFNDSLGIKAAVWEALTIMVGALSVYWLGKVVIKAIIHRKNLSLKSLLTRIKDTQAGK
ncbi:TPA: hypothetical protein NJZ52_004429 [Vibrio parahaemolyticus]|nr:hypothetical protein [Vibrio parahaemolyticus]ELA7420895.1 hypothetical protein [Vibrio parahaemolyticus]HCG5296665.1 hypothetical protein [Vibrio parahaemolyticus]